jgi:hypothetical protein
VGCQTCESQVHHNLYPLSIKLLEGEPLRVVSHKVDVRGRTLCWFLEASTSAIHEPLLDRLLGLP